MLQAAAILDFAVDACASLERNGTGRAAASRRPPNRDGFGARVPISWQPRSGSVASFLL